MEVGRFTDTANIVNQAMYLILNLDVGGDWAGHPDATTPSPTTWYTDYIRVWQLEQP